MKLSFSLSSQSMEGGGVNEAESEQDEHYEASCLF